MACAQRAPTFARLVSVSLDRHTAQSRRRALDRSERGASTFEDSGDARKNGAAAVAERWRCRRVEACSGSKRPRSRRTSSPRAPTREPRNRRRPVGGTGERAAIHAGVGVTDRRNHRRRQATSGRRARTDRATAALPRRSRCQSADRSIPSPLAERSVAPSASGRVGPDAPAPAVAESPARLSADVTDPTGHPWRRQSRIVKSGAVRPFAAEAVSNRLESQHGRSTHHPEDSRARPQLRDRRVVPGGGVLRHGRQACCSRLSTICRRSRPSTTTRPASSRACWLATASVVGEFATERRQLVTFEEIPEVLRHAIMAAEDGDFMTHGGLKADRMILAAVKDVVDAAQHSRAQHDHAAALAPALPRIGRLRTVVDA